MIWAGERFEGDIEGRKLYDERRRLLVMLAVSFIAPGYEGGILYDPDAIAREACNLLEAIDAEHIKRIRQQKMGDAV